MDSIPNAYEPYEPAASKWAIVREMSFHSFSKRSSGIKTSSESNNSGRRTSTLVHTDSALSAASGKATARSQNSLSRTTTANELNSKGEPLRHWDGTLLDWVQVLEG
jgi:carbohydrate-binding DOMON domain-containing protein